MSTFSDDVLYLVREKLGDNYKVSINSVLKNNGFALTGIIIKANDSNISPNIYLESLKDLSAEDAADKIIEIYNSNKSPSVDLNYFFNFDNVRDKIIPKLINTERNEELLSTVPHVNWLDLSIIFQVFIEHTDEATASITIRNEHAKLWNASVSDLYEIAKININKINPYKIQTMAQTLSEIARIQIPDNFMYILTSANSVNGAYYMTCNYVFKRFTEKLYSDILILPSSIHECILLPDGGFPVKDLKQMVYEINRSQLKQEDFLSDSIYKYSVSTNSISRAYQVL